MDARCYPVKDPRTAMGDKEGRRPVAHRIEPSGQHQVEARNCWVHCGDVDRAFQAQHQHQRMVRGELDVETTAKTKQGIEAQNEID